MRPLSRLWQSLEALPGLAAIPAFWECHCGADVELLRPHLRVTDLEEGSYPCPRPGWPYCPRRIVDYGDGQYAALCRDPHGLCERIELTRKDVLVQELDLAAFTRALATPLGIHWQTPRERHDGIFAIGLSTRRETRAQPVFLAILPDRARFRASVQQLLLGQSGPLVLMTPTSRHHTVEVQELLQRRGIALTTLDEQLAIDDAGQIIATRRPESAGDFQATPIPDRKRVVQEVLKQNRCKVKDLQNAAGVDRADYYKWLNGTLPDHYSACLGIEQVLRRGLPGPEPQSRKHRRTRTNDDPINKRKHQESLTPSMGTPILPDGG